MAVTTGANKWDLKTSARYMGVSHFTLRSWIRERRLPIYRLGRRIVLDPADVEAFLAANRVPAREERAR